MNYDTDFAMWYGEKVALYGQIVARETARLLIRTTSPEINRMIETGKLRVFEYKEGTKKHRFIPLADVREVYAERKEARRERSRPKYIDVTQEQHHRDIVEFISKTQGQKVAAEIDQLAHEQKRKFRTIRRKTK